MPGVQHLAPSRIIVAMSCSATSRTRVNPGSHFARCASRHQILRHGDACPVFVKATPWTRGGVSGSKRGEMGFPVAHLGGDLEAAVADGRDDPLAIERHADLRDTTMRLCN